MIKLQDGGDRWDRGCLRTKGGMSVDVEIDVEAGSKGVRLSRAQPRADQTL